MVLDTALRSALALAIQARDVLWTSGSVLSSATRDGTFVALGADGNELRADALPVFRLSTDGEATDGNILDQEWDLTRADRGILPILANHTVRGEAPFGLGQWRNARVVSVSAKSGPDSRELHADADFARIIPMGAQASDLVRGGYLRSVSMGWKPGFRTLRGDLPKDHRWYRTPMTDDCGTRIEGYVMGRADDPNLAVEGSMTPIPSDPGATQVDGQRSAIAIRSLASLAQGERASGADLGAILLAIRGRPGVREWARSVLREELATLEGRALLRSLLTEPAPAPRTLAQVFKGA